MYLYIYTTVEDEDAVTGSTRLQRHKVLFLFNVLIKRFYEVSLVDGGSICIQMSVIASSFQPIE